MTSDDITRLTPLVEDLQKRGIVATWSTTSWPDIRDGYVHAFRLRSATLHEPLIVATPFTEDELVRRLATAEARQNHGPAIEATFALSKEALIRDLAALYVSRLHGKALPVPDEVVIKDLRVPLTPSIQ